MPLECHEQLSLAAFGNCPLEPRANRVGRDDGNSEQGRSGGEVQLHARDAAVALAISGGGALSSFETTVLLTVEESRDALQKAGEIRYQAPGAN